ncbi:tripartite tricarboxylate transporter TctB family protein [Pseudoxanthobacter sp. M-2]
MRWRLPQGITVMDLVVLAVFVTAAFIASEYTARARMVPVIVTIGSAMFLLVHIGLQIRGASLDIDQRELMGRDVRRAAETAEAEEQALAAHDGRQIVTYQGGSLASGLAIIAGFPALIFLVGMLPAVFLFTFGFLLFISKFGLVRSLLAAVATEVVVYGLFVAALGVRMNQGILLTLLS